ncbi:DUF2691 family protein [Bacillus toyonensis]|uniref:DUF2691 family protein n=1 Tax=Bacillus toyonensis TaxID=155322 RepID=UPI000BF72DC9|nr:DUF2691 family protein [Bacillus toyonensis]PGB95055.1 hypothetical protein COM19_24730 [Bacillus toyonensis]
MNIGINFVVPQDTQFHISVLDLLKNYNFQDYLWQIDDADVFIYDSFGNITDEPLFENKRFLNGNKMGDILKNKNFDSIFFTICTFPDTKKSNPTWIRTAADFLNTDCEFILSIVDGFDIRILCKDKDLLKALYQHVQNLGYVGIEYLTENNSGTF